MQTGKFISLWVMSRRARAAAGKSVPRSCTHNGNFPCVHVRMCVFASKAIDRKKGLTFNLFTINTFQIRYLHCMCSTCLLFHLWKWKQDERQEKKNASLQELRTIYLHFNGFFVHFNFDSIYFFPFVFRSFVCRLKSYSYKKFVYLQILWKAFNRKNSPNIRIYPWCFGFIASGHSEFISLIFYQLRVFMKLRCEKPIF